MEQYSDRLNSVVDKFSGGKVEETVALKIDHASYEGRIPQGVFDLWEKVGAGPFFDGYFQLCAPQAYRGIINQVFDGDSQIAPAQTHAVGFSAFGEIIAWNEQFRDVRINLVSGQIACRSMFNPKPHIDPSVTILSRLLLADDPSFDVLGTDGKGLFKSAKLKLGKLQAGHIYGFTPILALGGNRAAESIKIYEALPHMAILAQAHHMHLVDNSVFPPKLVRIIGS
ncbi:GAD-like domain-containing protein [Rhizobium hidalgonense]|uniref:GAD-like domain-containing protein n=1 Tax=Rhizobium hidalgonense TaxID=1538159 RepID=UPI002872A13F|nr:GAD-like domain-containing protein [Rhizobium hidalgonense]MDR9803133.1 GAD-like domain-containing protein [Rhizobium hidalgonense]